MPVENPKPWKLFDYSKKKTAGEYKTMEALNTAKLAYLMKSKSPPDKVVPVWCPHIPPAEFVRRQRPFAESLIK